MSRGRDAQILTRSGGPSGAKLPTIAPSANGSSPPALGASPVAAQILRPVNRRSRGVAAILKEWRRLTSPATARRAGTGAPTLVACSGGADSAALVLALSAAARSTRIVVAHVVHDLREPALALADRDAVRSLARALGLEFVEAAASVGGGSNAEGLARRERYRALARLACEAGVEFIATAHHADDQLESVLMALVRGSGPRGLAGVARSRTLAAEGDGHAPWRGRLIRPMLTVTRADAEAICLEAGYEARVDHTNADTSRLRNALRAHVTPVLRALRPAAARKSVQAAALQADAAALIRSRAQRAIRAATPVDEGGIRLARRAFARLSDAVAGETLRLGAARVSPAGADRRSSRSLAAIIRAVRDRDGSTRRFTFGGVHAVLTADSLTLSPAASISPELSLADRRLDRPRPRPDHAC